MCNGSTPLRDHGRRVSGLQHRQFLLLKLLVGPETFVGVVGDDDGRSIGSGGGVKNILTFASSFPSKND